MNFDDRTRSRPWDPQIDTHRGDPPSEFSILAEACLYFIYRDRMHISKHLIGRYEYSAITYGLAHILWDNRGDNVLDPAILEVVASGRWWRKLPTPKVRAEVKKMWKAAQALPRPDFTYIHQELPQVGLEDHHIANIDNHQQHAELEEHQHAKIDNHQQLAELEDHQRAKKEGHHRDEGHNHAKNKRHHHLKNPGDHHG